MLEPGDEIEIITLEKEGLTKSDRLMVMTYTAGLLKVRKVGDLKIKIYNMRSVKFHAAEILSRHA